MSEKEKKQLPAELELQFSFSRSSGPGGQNVNKTNTKAILHWSVKDSLFLDAESKHRFMSLFKNRINIAGMLVLTCDEYRDQKRNMDTCLNKLKNMIFIARAKPKKRYATKPTKNSQIRRQNEKTLHKNKKKQRNIIPDE